LYCNIYLYILWNTAVQAKTQKSYCHAVNHVNMVLKVIYRFTQKPCFYVFKWRSTNHRTCSILTMRKRTWNLIFLNNQQKYFLFFISLFNINSNRSRCALNYIFKCPKLDLYIFFFHFKVHNNSSKYFLFCCKN